MLFVLIACGWVTGCQSSSVRRNAETSVSQVTRNNCYSLLHQLMNEEKDVSKLHFIKHENADLKNLAGRISGSAKIAKERLEEFAEADSSLELNDYSLPLGEKKTRDSIGAAKQKELLHESGGHLELTLLLTQVEALNYASHLAKVAGQNDFLASRAQYLEELSKQMEALHDEVVGRLMLIPSSQVK